MAKKSKPSYDEVSGCVDFNIQCRVVRKHINSNLGCNNLLLQMAILTEFCYLHFSLKLKDVLPKKVSSDFSCTLTYLTLKYERNRIFHPCHENLVLSDFYRQAFLINCIQDD